MAVPAHQAPNASHGPRFPAAGPFNFPASAPGVPQVDDSVVVISSPGAPPGRRPPALPSQFPPESDPRLLSRERPGLPVFPSGPPQQNEQAWPHRQGGDDGANYAAEKPGVTDGYLAVSRNQEHQPPQQQQQQHGADYEQTPMWESLTSLLCSIFVMILSIIVASLIGSAKYEDENGDDRGIEHYPCAQFLLSISVICLALALALVVLEGITLGTNVHYRRSYIVLYIISVIYAMVSFLLFASACSVMAVYGQIEEINDVYNQKVFNTGSSFAKKLLGAAICALIGWLVFLAPLILLIARCFRSPKKGC